MFVLTSRFTPMRLPTMLGNGALPRNSTDGFFVCCQIAYCGIFVCPTIETMNGLISRKPHSDLPKAGTIIRACHASPCLLRRISRPPHHSSYLHHHRNNNRFARKARKEMLQPQRLCRYTVALASKSGSQIKFYRTELQIEPSRERSIRNQKSYPCRSSYHRGALSILSGIEQLHFGILQRTNRHGWVGER
eukprot:scaffold42784_cov214-Amphora_coffeaeformis.AAC.5